MSSVKFGRVKKMTKLCRCNLGIAPPVTLLYMAGNRDPTVGLRTRNAPLGMCVGSVETKTNMAVGQKYLYPTWNPGKWKHGPKPAAPLLVGFILTHTHLVSFLLVRNGWCSRGPWRCRCSHHSPRLELCVCVLPRKPRGLVQREATGTSSGKSVSQRSWGCRFALPQKRGRRRRGQVCIPKRRPFDLWPPATKPEGLYLKRAPGGTDQRACCGTAVSPSPCLTNRLSGRRREAALLL